MIKFEHIPNYIYEKYISWKSDTIWGRRPWLTRAFEAEEYYYNDVAGTGTTYTSSQITKITDNTNIPVSINFLHPVCNQKLAILTQTKPSLKIISTDGRAKNHAAVLDKMKHAVLHSSHANIEIESMIKDMLISGMGHVMVVPTDFYRQGLFNLSVVSVPYDEVILDINSKRRTLEDMEGFFIEKAFTLPKLMQLYADIISELKDQNGNPIDIKSFTGQVWIEGELTEKADVTTTAFNADDRIIVREYYEKIFTTLYMIPDPSTGMMIYEFEENLDLDQQSFLAQAVKKYDDIFIKKTLLFGDFVVWTEILPISEYPLKTAFFEWGGRPYRSYGMIHFTQSMQEAFDKIIQIMILNGILSNNAGWIAPKGSITEEDRKKWENFGNDPRTIKEYVPKIYDNQVLFPQRDQIQQLSNFYPMVLEMLKNGIEYSTGISAILQGNAKDAGVEVFSSLQQYQNAAMMRIILATFHINETLRQIGQTLVEYMVASLTPDTFSFFDEKGQLNEMSLTQELVNDIKLFKYLVTSIPSTAMPTQRLSVATELLKIAQSSPDPSERQILTQKAMELSDIREFDELKDQIDTVKNIQGKLQSLQAAYDRLMETSKQMENKFVNISLENRILTEMSSKEQKIASKFGELDAKLKIANQLANQQLKPEKPSQQ